MALAAALAAPHAFSTRTYAGTIWDGGGVNDNWSNGRNWNGLGLAQLPPPNDGTANIVMAGTIRPTPVVDVPYSINSLTFNNTAGSFVVIAAEELTIGAGGVTNNDSQLQTVVGPMKLAASQTWNAAAGRLQMDAVNLNGFELTFAGASPIDLINVISGAGGLTLPSTYTGAVTMLGGGSNTYSGPTRVDGGTLLLRRSPGIAIPGHVIIGEGDAPSATVRLLADEQISHAAGNRVELQSNGLLDLNGHTETIASLVLYENSAVTTGTGKLIVGDSIWGSSGVITGNVDSNGGILSIGGLIGIDGPISNGGVTFYSGHINLRGAANTYAGLTWVDDGAYVYLNKSEVDGAFRGDVKIWGTVELYRNEQILAAVGNEVFLEGGELNLGYFAETVQDLTLNGGIVYGHGDGTLTVLGAISILPEFTYGSAIESGLNLQGARTFSLQSDAASLSVGGRVSNGSVVKTGPGTLLLQNSANTYSGGTFIDEGTVRADSDGALGAGAININGGFFAPGSPDYTNTPRSIVWGPNGGGFDLAAATLSFTLDSQTLSGPGPLTKLGPGKLTLLAPQSYTGGTTVAGGTLEGHTASLQGNIVNHSIVAFNQSSDGAHSGNLSGAGALTKLGSGAVRLTGNNIYSGATTVSAGALELAGGNAIGDLSAVTLSDAAGVRIDLADSNETIGSLSGGGASGGNIHLGTGSLTTGGNGASTVYAGTISGPGVVAKTGAGTWTLSGSNAYSGGTTFAGGVISASSDANLGDLSGPLRFDGGALRVTGSFATTRAGDLLAGGGAIDVANTDNLFTYAGNITGVGSLTKLGPGKLVLSGPQSYTGGTTVMAGTLEGDAESLQGSILNNASLVFSQAIDATFAGNLSGAGQLLKRGSGALSLTGTITGTGVVRVDGGALSVSSGGQISGSSGIYVGDTGNGRLHVTNGGQVSSGAGVIGNENGASGEVIIDGPASKWTIASDIQVGKTGAAAVNVINGGMLQAPNINVGPLGVVGGDGRLVGNLQNGGLVSPGSSPGALQVEGNYAQTPAGELLIQVASASSYDQLLITQDATLAGTLRVNLVGGFTPIAGQTFTLLTTDDVDFTFNTEVLPSVPGVTFDVVYNTQSVVLTVSAALTADFDSDGDVDGNDLAQWRGDFGVNALSDADSDGDSDGADFLSWQRQAGNGASARAAADAVPEPSALALVWLAGYGLALVRQRRR